MKVNFLNIPLDAITMQETLKKIDFAIKNGGHLNQVVINAGKVVAMRKDKELFKSVTSCDLINADGQSIVWAGRFLGLKIPERVAGIDLMEELVKLAFNNNYKCYFLGAKEEVVKKVTEVYGEKYNKNIIAGYRNGYFKKDEEAEVAQEIARSGAKILFVAISSPKKENFQYKYRDVLSNVNYTMGVGGSFDVVAGVTRRAPVWMQRAGLEWFYRFIQEPGRMWKRYLIGNTKFLLIILKAKFTKDYSLI